LDKYVDPISAGKDSGVETLAFRGAETRFRRKLAGPELDLIVSCIDLNGGGRFRFGGGNGPYRDNEG
jgi:hypothetical protein